MVFFTMGVLTLLSHIYFSTCILTELELCFQDEYTSSDILLKLMNIEINNKNRKKLTTYLVSSWLILMFIKIVK